MSLFRLSESVAGVMLEKHLSARAAAEHSGYNQQYLRRLLRVGRLEGVRIGQIWLITLGFLEAHLRKGRESQNQRFGPQGMVVENQKGVES